MGDNKTPVTALQEYCVGRKLLVPMYDELPMETDEATKIFKYRVTAADRVGVGQGSNKKIAKHSAAANLLEQLGIKTNYSPESGEGTQNSILKLLDLCVERNWPLAEFTEIQSSGPSHCPEFRIRCTLASMNREATAPSKKLAKGKAATMMLQVIQEMQMQNPEKLKLMEVKEAIRMEEEKDENLIRTYRQFKKAEIKKQPGVRLCDRHNFFVKQDPDKLKEARANLENPNESIPERINQAMIALGLKFEIKPEDSYGEPLKSFNLINDQYDCYFVTFADSFFDELYKYFKVMLYSNHKTFST